MTGSVKPDDWRVLYENAVRILNNIPLSEITLPQFAYPNIIYKKGTVGFGVYVIQHYLTFISQFIPEIPAPPINSIFDESTENSVKAFQSHFGMEPTGIVEKLTWDIMAEVYNNLKIEQSAIQSI